MVWFTAPLTSAWLLYSALVTAGKVMMMTIKELETGVIIIRPKSWRTSFERRRPCWILLWGSEIASARTLEIEEDNRKLMEQIEKVADEVTTRLTATMLSCTKRPLCAVLLSKLRGTACFVCCACPIDAI